MIVPGMVIAVVTIGFSLVGATSSLPTEVAQGRFLGLAGLFVGFLAGAMGFYTLVTAKAFQNAKHFYRQRRRLETQIAEINANRE